MSNRCQCKAGYAEGECKKHGLPIIHTITDDVYCPACRVVEEKLATLERCYAEMEQINEGVTKNGKEIA